MSEFIKGAEAFYDTLMLKLAENSRKMDDPLYEGVKRHIGDMCCQVMAVVREKENKGE